MTVEEISFSETPTSVFGSDNSTIGTEAPATEPGESKAKSCIVNLKANADANPVENSDGLATDEGRGFVEIESAGLQSNQNDDSKKNDCNENDSEESMAQKVITLKELMLELEHVSAQQKEQNKKIQKLEHQREGASKSLLFQWVTIALLILYSIGTTSYLYMRRGKERATQVHLQVLEESFALRNKEDVPMASNETEPSELPAKSEEQPTVLMNTIYEMEEIVAMHDKIPPLSEWKKMWGETGIDEIENANSHLSQLETQAKVYLETISLLSKDADKISHFRKYILDTHTWMGTDSDVVEGYGRSDYGQNFLLDCPVMVVGKVYQWTMVVEDLRYDSIRMGVVSNEQQSFNSTTALGVDSGGTSWGYRSNGDMFHRGNYISRDNPTYGKGSKVHFKLDLMLTSRSKGTLSALVNGSPQLDTYTTVATNVLDGINQENMETVGYRPAVSLAYNSKVRFLGFN